MWINEGKITQFKVCIYTSLDSVVMQHTWTGAVYMINPPLHGDLALRQLWIYTTTAAMKMRSVIAISQLQFDIDEQTL